MIRLLSKPPIPVASFLTILLISKILDSQQLAGLISLGIIDTVYMWPTLDAIERIDQYFNLQNLENFIRYSIDWAKKSEQSTFS
jgi:hypothetical protein